MMRTRLLVAVALLAMAIAAPCRAAVAWYDTYEEAQKVAKDQGRPMVAIVVRKGDKNVRDLKKLFLKRQLAWALRVFVFSHEEVEVVNNTIHSRTLARFRFQGKLNLPYFYFATPDGKVLGQTQDSSPANLRDMLRIAYRRHGPVADPKTLSTIVAKLKAADALYEKGAYARAARLYAEIVDTKAKAPPVEAARSKLAAIEKIATERLADARAEVEAKAYANAIDRLVELQRELGAFDAGRQARKELARLRTLPEAQDAFAALERQAAEPDAELGAAAVALDEAEWKLDGFTSDELDALDTMAAGEPAAPEPTRSDAQGKQCRRLLALARNWIQNKRPDKAKPLLRKVIETAPGTLYADQATILLSKLD